MATRSSTPSWAVARATQRQLDYIRDLIEQKNLGSEDLTDAQRVWLQQPQPDEFWEAETTRLSKEKASNMIGLLVELPRLIRSKDEISAGAGLPEVADGRYAVEDPMENNKLKFFRVKNGRSILFLDVYASDVRYPIKRNDHKKAVLDEIAKDPITAMRKFGEEIGACGRCGRTLTDPTSRAFGIGPECRQILGI